MQKREMMEMVVEEMMLKYLNFLSLEKLIRYYNN